MGVGEKGEKGIGRGRSRRKRRTRKRGRRSKVSDKERHQEGGNVNMKT